MKEKEDAKSLSPAMRSALLAVARMRGDATPDAVLWAVFLDEFDGRGSQNGGPRQESKPAEQ